MSANHSLLLLAHPDSSQQITRLVQAVKDGRKAFVRNATDRASGCFTQAVIAAIDGEQLPRLQQMMDLHERETQIQSWVDSVNTDYVRKITADGGLAPWECEEGLKMAMDGGSNPRKLAQFFAQGMAQEDQEKFLAETYHVSHDDDHDFLFEYLLDQVSEEKRADACVLVLEKTAESGRLAMAKRVYARAGNWLDTQDLPTHLDRLLHDVNIHEHLDFLKWLVHDVGVPVLPYVQNFVLGGNEMNPPLADRIIRLTDGEVRDNCMEALIEAGWDLSQTVPGAYAPYLAQSRSDLAMDGAPVAEQSHRRRPRA